MCVDTPLTIDASAQRIFLQKLMTFYPDAWQYVNDYSA